MSEPQNSTATLPQPPEGLSALIPQRAVQQTALDLSDVDARLILRGMYPKMTDQDEALFVLTCNRLGLDPFARQIHAVWRNTKVGDGWKEVMSIQVGIDGFRLQAERSRHYEGQCGPFWMGKETNGQWVEAWIFPGPPMAARVGAWRKGAREPVWGVATWQEYCQTTKDGNPNAMWKKMAATMLAKCSEAIALRRAFPAELAGMYSDEEMMQAENEVPVVIPHQPGEPARTWTRDSTSATQRPAEARNGAEASHSPPEGASAPQGPAVAPQNEDGTRVKNPYRQGDRIDSIEHEEWTRFEGLQRTVEHEKLDVPLIRQSVKLQMPSATLWSLNQAIEVAIAKARAASEQPPPVAAAGTGVSGSVSDDQTATDEQVDRIYALADQFDVEQVTLGTGEILTIALIDWETVEVAIANEIIRLLEAAGMAQAAAPASGAP